MAIESSASTPVKVSVRTTPLWRLRLAREYPRYVLCAVSLAGLVASARFAIAPPQPKAAAARPVPTREDLAAEGFAQLFVRSYLSWEANDPEARDRALAPFVGQGMEQDAGLLPPPSGEQQVQWTEVVQERSATSSERVYTVAAQTNTVGLQYVAVSVSRAPGGALEIASYPAFVGPPATAPAVLPTIEREVHEPDLQRVVERALRNYMGASGAELAADLTDGAEISLPTRAMLLDSIDHLTWSPEGGGAIDVSAQAQDGEGARYTLDYTLDVVRAGGRWEISAIEMDPDT